MESKNEVAVFGGGCFWCTEAVFQMLKGVIAVVPGYAGGSVLNPTYEQVSSGRTGHTEVIRLEYDPRQISYEELLTVFFATHNPTSLNRQENDVGTQYRSVVFFTTPEQKYTVERYIAAINSSALGDPIVTEVKPLDAFFEAEDYHKNYFVKNSGKPYCQVVINPKVKKVKAKFATLVKTPGEASTIVERS